MYAATPLAALMMTYGTLSPRFGALPGSRFLILRGGGHTSHTSRLTCDNIPGPAAPPPYLSASSTWACLPAYSWALLVSSLVMTSCEMSIRLHSRSEITSLACSTAPWGSLREKAMSTVRGPAPSPLSAGQCRRGEPDQPLDQDVLQAGVDEVGHQGAVVSAHSLYAFAVHFVVGVGVRGKIQASIALLVDQQVRVIDLRRASVRT